jgi:hypothetical protein
MPITTLIITLPLPPKELHPNGGKQHNRFKLARLVRERKRSAFIHTLAALNGRELRWPAATISYAIYLKSAAGAKLADDDNAAAWMKAYRDGIATATDINDRYFTTGKVTIDCDKANPRVEITLQQQEATR